MIALVRQPVPAITRCELTHLERAPIDFELVLSQHRAYCSTLELLGFNVVLLPELPDSPDGVFVEDTAVALDELAVITRPGALARLAETESVALTLRAHRKNIFRLEALATLDGGDVLRIGKTLFVGLSTRTNQEGLRQLATLVAPFGYEAVPVQVKGCLHLKTAVTFLGNNTVVANPAWIDPAAFGDFEILSVDPTEPFAGNTLSIGNTIVCAAHHERTGRKIASLGFRVVYSPISELAKAEAGLTCLSVLLA